MNDSDIMKRLSEMTVSVPSYEKLLHTKAFFAQPLTHFMSGEAAFVALQKEVDDLVSKAPADSDVLVYAFGLLVRTVQFIEPTVLVFRGVTGQADESSVIVHFTQLVAQVLYQPKAGPERIVTGFAPLGSKTADAG